MNVQRPLRSSLIFFGLLEIIHVPGVYLLDYLKQYGPSNGLDIFVFPSILTFQFFLLSLTQWKMNKGLVFGLFHIIFWLIVILVDTMTGEVKDCIDCERAEYFLKMTTGLICSFFALINHYAMYSLAETHFREILVNYGINIVLMAFYLICVINLAIYLEKTIFKIKNF